MTTPTITPPHGLVTQQQAAAERSAVQMLMRVGAQQQLARADHRLSLVLVVLGAALHERERAAQHLRQVDQAEHDANMAELSWAVRRYLTRTD